MNHRKGYQIPELYSYEDTAVYSNLSSANPADAERRRQYFKNIDLKIDEDLSYLLDYIDVENYNYVNKLHSFFLFSS